MFPKSGFTLNSGKPTQLGKDAATEINWTFAFNKPEDVKIWHDIIDKEIQNKEVVKASPIQTSKNEIIEEEEESKNEVYKINKGFYCLDRVIVTIL